MPGVIFADAFKAAALEDRSLGALASRMPHALVLFPYVAELGFEKCDLERHRVWFLQVVPLLHDELRHIERHGFEAFEESTQLRRGTLRRSPATVPRGDLLMVGWWAGGLLGARARQLSRLPFELFFELGLEDFGHASVFVRARVPVATRGDAAVGAQVLRPEVEG